jgi:putative transposase
MVLVKPTTVLQWHRRGFRLVWRWRSGARGPGRPRLVSEVRGLIRQMSRENPLWGAPRIHGELLKIGIKVSQVTVGRYMPWRPKEPSPTWRSFLQNHATDIAATDMFVVVTATFRILYAMIVLDHNRRRVIHFDVTGNPTQAWLARQITEAFPWETAPVICCETATPRMASASAIMFEPWVSRRSLSHPVHPGKIRLSNASSARSIANV